MYRASSQAQKGGKRFSQSATKSNPLAASSSIPSDGAKKLHPQSASYYGELPDLSKSGLGLSLGWEDRVVTQ